MTKDQLAGRPAVLATALRLLDFNLWPVAITAFAGPGRFGSKNPGKQPVSLAGRLTGWGKERPFAPAIEEFFEEFPECGLGLKLGPDGGVIDIEVDSDDGFATLVDLFDGEIPDTMGWDSAKGPHYLFKWDDRFNEFKSVTESDAHNIFPGIGIRIGTGSKQIQSVCPPSPTSIKMDDGSIESGPDREWIAGTFGNIAELPETVISKLRDRFAELNRVRVGVPVPVAQEPARGVIPLPATIGGGYGPKALADECGKIEAAGEGGRNIQVNLSAFKVGQLVGGGELDAEPAKGALAYAGRRAGLGEAELTETIQSGFAAGMLNPRIRKPGGPDEWRVTVGVPVIDRDPAAPWNPPRAGGAGNLAVDPVRLPDGYTGLHVADGTAPRLRTDMGNADRLIDRYGSEIVYCWKWNQWLIWDGKRWSADEAGKIREFAKRTVRSIFAEAEKEESTEQQKLITAFAIASQGRERINAMIDLARSVVPISPDQLNRQLWQFNCNNGTIDLHTGQLMPHRKEDFHSQICPIDFDPDATAPLWESTLNLFFAGNVELIAYFRRICGYAMVGEIRDHILPIAYGLGANGKSTILEAVMKAFGPDYAMASPPDLLMQRRGDPHPTERAALFGKRLVIAIESEQDRRLNETSVKSLTGGDTISARKMRQDFWEFQPSHTIILATNHRPEINGTDLGIWRRVKFIEFGVTLAKADSDESVPSRLRGELAGILAWCLRGCVEWREHGLAEIDLVTSATEEYRRDQDVIGSFLNERCRPMPGQRVKAGAMFADYLDWCKGTAQTPINIKRFGREITNQKIEKDMDHGTYYLGLVLVGGSTTVNNAFA